MQSAGKKEVIRGQSRLLHPFTNRAPSWLGDFKLDWLGRFLLQDKCTGRSTMMRWARHTCRMTLASGQRLDCGGV